MLLAGRAFFWDGVCLQGNELSLLAVLCVSVFQGLLSSLSFNGGSWPFRVLVWGLWGPQKWSPSYDGCPKQDMGFPNCRDWRSTSGPFLHAPVPGLPEALLGNRFAADRGCSSCLGLGCSNLLESHRELCLLGTMGLLPQQVSLFIEELIQSG